MGCVGLHRVPCGINCGIFRHGSALVILAAAAALALISFPAKPSDRLLRFLNRVRQTFPAGL